MPNYRSVAIRAAKQNGVDPNIFLRQIQQESGFNPNARSGAGAIGIAQIVPRWHPGVDATDPVASLNYAAHWMGQLVKKYGNYQQALSVYNSGQPDTFKDKHFAGGQTFNYVRSIMQGAGSPAVTPAVAPTVTPTQAPFSPAAPMRGTSLLAGLQEVNRQLGLPSIKWPALPGAGSLPPGLVSTLPFKTGTPLPMTTLPMQQGDVGKWVKLSSSANRSGMPLQSGVVDFVAEIARDYGHPLTIGTGTNHNQYVQGSRRESAHWTGWAADVPSSGAALTKLGQDALIAAGANPKWARQQKGGLFNVNGKQIIFNSMIGGNHFNHLHVGLSRS